METLEFKPWKQCMNCILGLKDAASMSRCSFKFSAFLHKNSPPHESIFPKKTKTFQSTFSEFYNNTESQHLGKSALLWEQVFDVTAVSLIAHSNIGIINGQTPLLMSASGESLCCGKKKQCWRQCPVFQQPAGQGFIVKSLKKEEEENNAECWGWVYTQERWENLWWRTPWLEFLKDCMVCSYCWRNRMCGRFISSSNIDISVLHFQFLLSQSTDLPTHTHHLLLFLSRYSLTNQDSLFLY